MSYTTFDNNSEQHYPNVRICETTIDDFDARPDDIVIINIAEYFLTQKQLSGFVSKGGCYS
jgi:hypothetical protein